MELRWKVMKSTEDRARPELGVGPSAYFSSCPEYAELIEYRWKSKMLSTRTGVFGTCPCVGCGGTLDECPCSTCVRERRR